MYRNLVLMIRPYFFKNIGPPNQSIFLTTFYGLYFSHQFTNIKITFLHDIDLLWAAVVCVCFFSLRPPMKLHYYDVINARAPNTYWNYTFLVNVPPDSATLFIKNRNAQVQIWVALLPSQSYVGAIANSRPMGTGM